MYAEQYGTPPAGWRRESGVARGQSTLSEAGWAVPEAVWTWRPSRERYAVAQELFACVFWSWASWLARPLLAPSRRLALLPPMQGLPGGRRCRRAFTAAIAHVPGLWGTDDLPPVALEEDWRPHRIGCFSIFVQWERRYGRAYTEAFYDWMAASNAEVEDGASAASASDSGSDDDGTHTAGLSYSLFSRLAVSGLDSDDDEPRDFVGEESFFSRVV